MGLKGVCKMVSTLGKEIVRIYTDGSELEGQFVKCTDCGVLQLVSMSQKKCENCGNDTITLVNEDIKEISPEKLEEIGYELEFVIG